jgi:hypothetical protein
MIVGRLVTPTNYTYQSQMHLIKPSFQRTDTYKTMTLSVYESRSRDLPEMSPLPDQSDVIQRAHIEPSYLAAHFLEDREVKLGGHPLSESPSSLLLSRSIFLHNSSCVLLFSPNSHSKVSPLSNM